ncbi:MAG: DUF429 domain-containing protein [Caulobacterales bacterium]|nr:DUF429 domain-containing protein [Caulobacterales bacterium]
MSVWVAGLDGCPAGWIAALLDLEADGPPRLMVLSHFAEVLEFVETPDVIGVDMPIGFPDLAAHGGRACARAARRRLGPRRSSVFAAPSRPALACNDYRAALAANRAGGGPGLSKQCFFLFPKMREIDAVMTPVLQTRVVEAHPELAFTAMAGAPMSHAKRLANGRAERLEALAAAGFAMDALAPHPLPSSQVKPDDLLDACAVAWSATRVARGMAERLPPAPPRDSKGLRMEIVF